MTFGWEEVASGLCRPAREEVNGQHPKPTPHSSKVNMKCCTCEVQDPHGNTRGREPLEPEPPIGLLHGIVSGSHVINTLVELAIAQRVLGYIQFPHGNFFFAASAVSLTILSNLAMVASSHFACAAAFEPEL